jgi:hypothetical protein
MQTDEGVFGAMVVEQHYITSPPLASLATPPEPIWRLSVEQYHEMIAARELLP